MKVIVVGGGAAGMMAAIRSAELGAKVTLIEKNEKLGKKLYITGKGRCNLTNACGSDEFFKNVISNPKFMYSAYNVFTAEDTYSFFESRKLPLKTERGNRVFPKSDHSSDVIGALKREINRLGVKVLYNTKVTGIAVDTDKDSGIAKACGVYIAAADVSAKAADISAKATDVSSKAADALTKTAEISTKVHDGRVMSTAVKPEHPKMLTADKIILATGGKSYSSCGADGDTWKFAKELSIKTVAPEPSLVPFEVSEKYVQRLQGLSLKNVSVDLRLNDKSIYSGFGEMLFTHFGLSGPLILTASAYVKEKMYSERLSLSIDLKPALSEEELDKRILRDFSKALNKQFSNSLSELLPAKLIPVIVELSGISPHKQVNAVTKEERLSLVKLLKDMLFTVTGNRGFDEAIITRGGIDVKEINPKTMESKKIKGLFFAGEMIDVDCLTGGFNLQVAWSTGHAAGSDA